MAAIRYSGPHLRVSVPLPTGRWVEVSKGKEIDLRDDEHRLTAAQADQLTKDLLEQADSWVEATPAKATKSDKKED